MTSKEHIKNHLATSMAIMLGFIEQSRDAQAVSPTLRGGGHPLWVLGHLACSEGLIVREWMLGEANPWAELEPLFGEGTEPVADAAAYPPFDDLLALARSAREATLALLEGLSEEDLDRPSANCPQELKPYFGTYRQCLQTASDHWYMHRGQIADARRSAGLAAAAAM